MQHAENPKEHDGSISLRAAQYVRMSTDHQKYSIHNQSTVIADYAVQRGLEIVRTYSDEGRSGLRIAGRDGLQQLIDDVVRADFGHILVYDVSRWGRFQDVDESAYYEFICKRAGINVHYCADEFENDGSFASTILKTMKRAAAGDFSRQLSRRMFICQCHMTELGLWRGGSAGYGLRRLLIDPNGSPITQLEHGQRKAVSSERVILRPGPSTETKTVKRIFNSFVSGRTFSEIANDLNGDNIRNGRARPWSAQTIIKILENEAYIGTAVYNRTSFKLKEKAVINPPEMWIRRPNAYQPIIPCKTFERAQVLIAKRRRGRSDQDLLDQVKALWTKKGHLSSRIMDAAEDIAHTTVYMKRFGSLRAVYERIGFRPKRRYRWVETEAAMDQIIAVAVSAIIARISQFGGAASFEPKSRLLSIEQALTVTIGSARCVCEGVGQRRWHVRINRHATTDLTLIFRMDTGNARILDYYLIPTADFTAAAVNRIRITSRPLRNASRYDDLDAFYGICAERLAACGLYQEDRA